jgi:hypothetical protein
MRRRALLWAGAIVGVVVVVVGVIVIAFRDRATPLDAGDVAETTVVPGGSEPGDHGLYVYETSGFETTGALGGARHDYPAETFLTLQPGGCGTVVRWQSLEQRWTEWEICDDLTLAGWDSFHEWFGVANLDEWTCPEPVAVTGEAGTVWEAACSMEGTTRRARYEALGREMLEIDGEMVETLHVRSTSTTTGETRGEATTDAWLLPGTPLVVQRVVEKSSLSASRIGDVEYREEYRVRLRSLVPGS